MNLEQRLQELPPEWRHGVPVELLEASFHPNQAPDQSIVPPDPVASRSSAVPTCEIILAR